jgi:AcrR family transcriptional regulator
MDKATSREHLLDAVVEVALETGIADQSLRAIAEACGTSHRMLIHHFGSKERLFVEVVKVVEARQRAQLGALMANNAATGEDFGQRFWEKLRSPKLARQERLFFEIYAQALQGRGWATPLLDGIVDDWFLPLSEVFRAAGMSDKDARAVGRLCVAVSRGLLLDVLATRANRDVDAAMKYFLEMLRCHSISRSQ